MADLKKKVEDDSNSLDQAEEYRKKMVKEMEAMNNANEELKLSSDKLEKTKKRLQAEVSHGWIAMPGNHNIKDITCSE